MLETSKAIRVCYVHTRHRPRRPSLILLTGAFIFFFCVPLVFFVININSITNALREQNSPVLIIGSFFAAVACFYLLFLWYLRWKRARDTRREMNKARIKRIECLKRRFDITEHFPGRLVELALYGKGPGIGFSDEEVPNLSPETVVVCDSWRRMEMPHPKPTATHFEPVMLNDSEREIVDLIDIKLIAQGDDPARWRSKYQRAEDRLDAPSLGEQARGALSLTSKYLWLYLPSFYWFIIYPYRNGVGCFTYCWAAFLLWHFVRMAIKGGAKTEWWIVPGGLLRRDLGRKTNDIKVHLVTPKDTPLIVGSSVAELQGDSFSAILKIDGRWQAITCTQRAGWALVASWIGTVPPPTVEQLEVFAGVE